LVRSFFRGSVALAGVALISPVTAAPNDKSSPPEFEEIVVTGDRQASFSADLVQAGTFRGAKQLDTPTTVAVLPRTLLEAQQASSLLDGLRNTAGVTGLLVSPTVYDNLSIRGIPVDGRGNYRLNGTLSIVNFIDLPLENKERIEVLKGVSTLYYGFSTPSGIVNLVTKRPPSRPLLNVAGTANSHGQLQAIVDMGATVGAFGGRGSIAVGPVDLGIERTRGRRSFQSGALQFKPFDQLQLNFDFERIFKEVTEPTILQGPEERTQLLTSLPKLPPAKTNPGSEGFMNRASEINVLGRLRWKATDRWNVTLEAGVSHEQRDRRFSLLTLLDPNTGDGILFVGVAKNQKFENRTLRGDVGGIFTTGGLTHELLVGATTNWRRQYFTRATIVAGVDTDRGRTGCVALGLESDCVQNAGHPQPLRDIRFEATLPYDPSRDTEITDSGYYAFDRVRFGGSRDDAVNILLGARKSNYRETVATASGSRRTTFQDAPVSVSAGLVLKLRRWASLYGSYIEGLESLPPAPNFTANEGEILPPAESRQLEAGLKVQPKSGLVVTIARFDIRRQLTYINADNRFVSNGIGHYRGWEAGVAGEVSSTLSIYGSAMRLDAVQSLTGDPLLDGKIPENAAKEQWSIFAEFRLPGVRRGVALNAGIFHTGKRPINPENSVFIPAFTLLDFGASYTFNLRGTEMIARVTASNVVGKRYFISTGSNLLAYGPPAAVKFSLLAKLIPQDR